VKAEADARIERIKIEADDAAARCTQRGGHLAFQPCALIQGASLRIPRALSNARSCSAMDSLDYWRLCDELSVVQAALLIVGEDPSALQWRIDKTGPHDRPVGYDAAKAALVHAIRGKRLPARIIERHEEQSFGEPELHETTVLVEDLRAWLQLRGIKTGFFFPALQQSEPDYLVALHDHYSPKLAAAIEAWKAVSADRALRLGKTVKQALVVWLRQHANDGNPNEQGIDEVAKIANWDTKGGAPKTPGNE
jgi:hypothetical protein